MASDFCAARSERRQVAPSRIALRPLYRAVPPPGVTRREGRHCLTSFVQSAYWTFGRYPDRCSLDFAPGADDNRGVGSRRLVTGGVLVREAGVGAPKSGRISVPRFGLPHAVPTT